MELLHVKIFDLLLEPDLDFLSFPKHETGWGGKIPRPRYLHHPTLFYWHAMRYVT